MATVHITFRSAVGLGGASVEGPPRVAETLSSSGSSEETSITSQVGEVATITAVGGAAFVAYGANPEAGQGVGDLLPDGARIQIGGLPAGSKVAVVDA